MKDKIKGKLDEIRADHSETVPIGEITAVVESILTSMSGDISSSDFKLYHELEVLALYIDNAKMEIASLRPDEIQHEPIPSATDELDPTLAHPAGAVRDSPGRPSQLVGRRHVEVVPEGAARLGLVHGAEEGPAKPTPVRQRGIREQTALLRRCA